jgi:hypothetical protein
VILYGMWTGGVVRCSGTTTAGARCKRRLYATDQARGEYCAQHKHQQ